MLGDDLLDAEVSGVRQLIDVYEKTGTGVIALKEVPAGQEHMYGIVDGERAGPRQMKIRKLVEKPAPGTAPSRMAIIGRYVLPPEIFPILAETKPGKGGEIQLTDGLATLCERRGLAGLEVEGRRDDVGDRAGYVVAMVHYALKRADIADDVRGGHHALAGGDLRKEVNRLGGSGRHFLEVAVALPVQGTFTYRDPRPGAAAPIGAQVVVPFGARTVTGFVVARARDGGGGPAGETRDIEEVVAGEPAFDEAMIAFGRWVADYYQAPLGEVLRAALPQGEQASATRAVRLTDGGPAGARAAAGRSFPTRLASIRRWRRSRRRAASCRCGGWSAPCRAPRASCRGWSAPGWSRWATRSRTAGRRRRWPTPAPRGCPRTGLPKRASVKRALAEKLAAAGRRSGRGVAVGRPSARALRALVTAGLARIEHRPVARAPEALTIAAPAGMTLTPAQAHAVEALTAALGGGFGQLPAAGDHRIRQDRGLPACHRLGAGGRARRAGAGAGDRADAATRGALSRPIRRGRRGAPQRAAAARAAGGLAAAAGGRGRDRARRALRRLRAGARARRRRRRRGARPLVQAGRGRPLPRARPGGRARAARGRAGDPRLGDAVAGERVQCRARPLHAARAPRAGDAAAAARGRPSSICAAHPPGPDGLFSAPLAEALGEALAAGDQSILFLNRRGFSTLLLCHACGHVVRCPSCAVSMTYHRGRSRLVCHYCGRVQHVPERCPSCASTRLERMGTGTERVEAIVRERFPDARVARLDRDTAGDRGAAGSGLEEILARMHAGEIDVLVGTQMVTKGHDFPGVTLVGVLKPDQTMNLPDFRAAERTFQLIEQVAGRAGRGERPGRVVIQTYAPDHPSIVAAATHDYEGFVRGELAAREETGYPPFSRMIALRIDARDGARARAAAVAAAEGARRAGGPVTVRGPAEAPLAMLRGRVRWQVWLASRDRSAVAAAARSAAAAVSATGDFRLAVDVDPHSTL